jgi:hypothetical protein
MTTRGRVRRQKDLILGSLFVAGSAALAVLTRGYQIGSAREMGPGFLPLILACCLGLLGLILVAQSFWGERDNVQNIVSRPLLMILGSATLFGLLIRPAGAAVAILALVAGAALAHPRHTLVSAAITAIVLAGVSVLLFAYLLGQQIPVLGYWF